jgi:hypothetical protein
LVTRWVLYPYRPEFIHLQDEFVIDGGRIRVGGNTIEVESDDTALAQRVAERYVEWLQRHFPGAYHAISQEEYASYPPEVVGGWGSSLLVKEDPGRKDRARRAVREVRNEMLKGGDAALRRSYDYLQDAREREKGQSFDLYKVVETTRTRSAANARPDGFWV